MTQTFKVKKTVKQQEAIRLFNTFPTVNLAGGSRSGKTFIVLYYLIMRCLKYPGTKHLVVRFRFNHAKRSICHQTMPILLKLMGLSSFVRLDKSEYFYIFPNGSEIWIGGLDDSDRLEKILGTEYATILINEGSQVSYDGYEILLTRLNPPRGIKGTMIVDYNPPSVAHWGYKLFVKGEYPTGEKIPEGMVASIQMNPTDNMENLSEEYIKDRLGSLTPEKQKRFLYGEYGSEDGDLWKRSWITYTEEIPELIRIVVGVDPSGTVDGDEVGIVVSGIDSSGNGYTLDDYSCNGTPAEWASEVVAAYNRWEADCIVAEKNYGGDMVEHTIKTANRSVNVKLVTSSRGKVLRAEPIAARYQNGGIKHRKPFLALEDEMCQYKPGKESPNHLDALVFSYTELYGDDSLTGFHVLR